MRGFAESEGGRAVVPRRDEDEGAKAAAPWGAECVRAWPVVWWAYELYCSIVCERCPRVREVPRLVKVECGEARWTGGSSTRSGGSRGGAESSAGDARVATRGWLR